MRFRQLPTDAHKAEASKKFGRYLPEGENANRSPLTEQSETLRKLIDHYLNSPPFKPKGNSYSYREILDFERDFLIMEGIRPTSRDIEQFAVSIDGRAISPRVFFQVEKIWSMIAALIEESTDTFFKLPIAHLPPIERLMWENKKNVTIIGDAGSSLGANMSSGFVRVIGNAGIYLGSHMRGGTIEVLGNASSHAGEMEGGRLIIHGDAGHNLGYNMKGGIIQVMRNVGEKTDTVSTPHSRGSIPPARELSEGSDRGVIFVDGDICDISMIRSGPGGPDIFHKGRLIYSGKI